MGPFVGLDSALGRLREGSLLGASHESVRVLGGALGRSGWVSTAAGVPGR